MRTRREVRSREPGGVASVDGSELLAFCSNDYLGLADRGRLAPGAWADLLVVDGDPTQELSMLADPERGPRLVMKAGRVYRDTLQSA